MVTVPVAERVMASLKVSVTVAEGATPVALSAGEELSSVGAVVSGGGMLKSSALFAPTGALLTIGVAIRRLPTLALNGGVG